MNPATLAPIAPAPQNAMGTLCSREVFSHRDYLVRFARRKLHDPALAEDVVHDVFEAVLRGRASFSGRSALRSWLVGILKNKLVDLIRDRARYQAMDFEGDGDDDGSNNQWLSMECPNAQPDEMAEQRERLSIVMARIAQLPDGLRDVMERRILNEESTEEVCESLGISQDSLFVRLHRARKRLAS